MEEEEEEDWEVSEIILVDGDIKFFHAYLFLLYLFLVCYELSWNLEFENPKNRNARIFHAIFFFNNIS